MSSSDKKEGQAEQQPTRTQSMIDPDTGEKVSFQVRSIRHRFKKGRGGALMGAIPTTKGQAAKKVLNQAEAPKT